MPDRTQLGTLILEAMERKKQRNGLKRYSLHNLAHDASTVQPYLTRVTHGKSMPSREKLIGLCKALECSQQEAIEIFKQTDYRAPTQEELDEHPSLLQTA